MAKKKKATSVKRFGPRYGRTIKAKLAKIEELQKQTYKCPSCHHVKVKRVSKGIWECKKCKAKFTSKAYTVAKLPVIKGETIEE